VAVEFFFLSSSGAALDPGVCVRLCFLGAVVDAGRRRCRRHLCMLSFAWVLAIGARPFFPPSLTGRCVRLVSAGALAGGTVGRTRERAPVAASRHCSRRRRGDPDR